MLAATARDAQRFGPAGISSAAAVNGLSLLGGITSQMGLLDDAEALLRETLTAHNRAGNVSGII